MTRKEKLLQRVCVEVHQSRTMLISAICVSMFDASASRPTGTVSTKAEHAIVATVYCQQFLGFIRCPFVEASCRGTLSDKTS